MGKVTVFLTSGSICPCSQGTYECVTVDFSRQGYQAYHPAHVENEKSSSEEHEFVSF
jgi:hypothetical protein